jgi:hypothetical protein
MQKNKIIFLLVMLGIMPNHSWQCRSQKFNTTQIYLDTLDTVKTHGNGVYIKREKKENEKHNLHGKERQW